MTDTPPALPRRPRGHPRVNALDARRIPSGLLDLPLYFKVVAIGGGKFMKGLRLAVDAYPMNNAPEHSVDTAKEEVK